MYSTFPSYLNSLGFNSWGSAISSQLQELLGICGITNSWNQYVDLCNGRLRPIPARQCWQDSRCYTQLVLALMLP